MINNFCIIFWNNVCLVLNYQELTGVYFIVHQCLTELMQYGAVAYSLVSI